MIISYTFSMRQIDYIMKKFLSFMHFILFCYTPAIHAQSMDFPIISFEKSDLRQLLKQQATHMHPDVMDKVVSVIHCRKQATPILTVIDYSLPSNHKRLWVFDLEQKKLLYHTYVAHGLFSGENYTAFFSNSNSSKQSSMGVFLTLDAYRGREGTSLNLEGLDESINDHAESRAIVMHGGHYAEEDFIKKYGRAGRSWGCPAIPQSISAEIINTIKGHNLLIAYFPSEKWFKKSAYLNCYNYSLKPAKHVIVRDSERPQKYQEIKEPVLFASDFKGQFKTEHPPILAISATAYQKLFKKSPPLSRMLRRSIANEEYIAISTQEFYQLAQSQKPQVLTQLHFIIPTIQSFNGHAKTVMKIVNLGHIQHLQTENFIVTTDLHPIQLNENNQFIRWLGL